MTIQPIETRYAGCRFRSRLEARWACFFDELKIQWQYEPQGYVIEDAAGVRSLYLPDFLLPDLGTWVEVKGSDAQLDRDRLEAAAISLPEIPAHCRGPRLLLLGPIPRPALHNWSWLGLDYHCDPVHDIGPYAADDRWVFMRGVPGAHLVPLYTAHDAFRWGLPGGLTEPMAKLGHGLLPGGDIGSAYQAARSARFEHEEAA